MMWDWSLTIHHVWTFMRFFQKVLTVLILKSSPLSSEKTGTDSIVWPYLPEVKGEDHNKLGTNQKHQLQCTSCFHSDGKSVKMTIRAPPRTNLRSRRVSFLPVNYQFQPKIMESDVLIARFQVHPDVEEKNLLKAKFQIHYEIIFLKASFRVHPELMDKFHHVIIGMHFALNRKGSSAPWDHWKRLDISIWPGRGNSRMTRSAT